MPAADLLDRHADRWQAATEHRFLDAVRDGTIDEAAFERWLVQDHRFVSGLLTFQRELVGPAQQSGPEVLAGGADALDVELAWFERQGAARGLDLTAAALPATEAYTALLQRLSSAPFAVAAVALWSLERVYLEAWGRAAPSTEHYREFVEHWTAPQFGQYVSALEVLADEALAEAALTDDGPAVLDQAEVVFGQVLDHEVAFWDMAFDPGPS